MTVSEGRDSGGPKPFLEALESQPARAAALLGEAHPADAALWLLDVDEDDGWGAFSVLAAEQQAHILEFAEEDLRHELVARMSAADLRPVVEELPSDEAVDVLAQADDSIAEDVLEALPGEEAQELRELAAYEPDTAGGVMTTEFVAVTIGDRIGDAVKAVKKEEDAEENLGVYVVDEDDLPVGYLSDRALLTHSIHDAVAEVMVEPFIVAVDEDQEEAASIVSKYGLAALAVVGDGGALLGVISADDAQGILEEEATEDVHRLVGTSAVQQTRLPVRKRVLQRLPLMAVTVAGGLLSAKVLALFVPLDSSGSEDTAAILRYLPLIVGLAGNVGVQSSTILVRAFATGEVERDRDLEVLGSEVSVGTLVGLFCGFITLFVAAWMEGAAEPNWALGYSVGVAIVAAVAWAALLGCAVPMGCRRLGIDPAIVAGPFLICLSDISGVGIYIVVASLLIGLN